MCTAISKVGATVTLSLSHGPGVRRTVNDSCETKRDGSELSPRGQGARHRPVYVSAWVKALEEDLGTLLGMADLFDLAQSSSVQFLSDCDGIQRGKPMAFSNTIDTRMDQMKAMAEACNRDLPGALAVGLLSGMDLRGCAFRCYSCSQARQCAQLLRSRPQMAAPPSYCANKETYLQLPKLPAPAVLAL